MSEYKPPESPEEKEVRKLLEEAEKKYLDREIFEAEEEINRVLEIQPENKAALNLKEKIKKIKQARIETRRKLVEQIFENAESYFNGGNMIGALQESDRVLKLNPKHQEAYKLYNKSYDNLKKVISYASDKDKASFKKAIKYHLNQDYGKAVNIFRKIGLGKNEIEYLLAQARVMNIFKKNKTRAEKYYKKAVKDYKKRRFIKAKENILNSLFIDKYNLEALVLLEEININLKANN